MNCNKYHRMISRMIDGELSHGESEGLRAHLVVCPGCSKLQSDLSMIDTIHNSLGDEEVPEGIISGYRTHEDWKADSRPLRFLRNAAVAAAVAAVIIMGGMIGMFLAETRPAGGRVDSGDPFNLEYLYANPPGSTGDLLLETVEGGS